MKRPYEKPILTNQPSNGTATGLPAMKRPYEKPTLTDLSQLATRGGWLPTKGASPDGACYTGVLVGGSTGQCQGGAGPANPTSCGPGTSAAPGSLCLGGVGVPS